LFFSMSLTPGGYEREAACATRQECPTLALLGEIRVGKQARRADQSVWEGVGGRTSQGCGGSRPECGARPGLFSTSWQPPSRVAASSPLTRFTVGNCSSKAAALLFSANRQAWAKPACSRVSKVATELSSDQPALVGAVGRWLAREAPEVESPHGLKPYPAPQHRQVSSFLPGGIAPLQSDVCQNWRLSSGLQHRASRLDRS
jgi:hypothetical protein